MARLRSVLMDNTLGRIFTNTEAPSKATPANLLAGTKLSTLTYASNKKTIVRLANNIGTTSGLKFVQRAQIVKIRAGLTYIGIGGNLTLNIRRGTTYQDSTVISSISIPTNTLTTELPVLLYVEVGQKLFVDIVEVHTVKAAVGLYLSFDYYTG